jgi:hypothetical protein
MVDEEKDTRFFRRAGALVILVLVLYGLVKVVFLPSDVLVRFTNDDTFYYLGIARNLAAGNGLTFDGLHQTNGFHPLWLGVCTVPFLLGAGDHTAWRIVMALTVLLWGLGLVLVRRVVARRFGERGALLPLVLFAWPQFLNVSSCGMEVTLAFALLFAALDVADRGGVFRFEGARGAEWGVGALLALLFLSRLDSFFVHVAAFVYLLAAYRRGGPGHGKGWRDLAGRFLRLFGPSVLALAGFLLWNGLTFGHLVPISGALKSSFPVPVFRFGQILLYREICFLAMLALVWTALRRRELDVGVRIVAWGFLGQLVYLLLFQKWAYYAYYLVPLGLSVSLLAVGHFFGHTLRGRLKWQRAFLVVAAVGVLAGQVVSWSRVKFGFQTYTYRAAQWASKNTADDAVFAMTDCGVFGYFCGRSCINLDGLVNNYSYQYVLLTGRLEEYLRDEGVDYIVHHALPLDVRDDVLDLVIPWWLFGGRCTYTLRSENIVYRGEPYWCEYGTAGCSIAIWKID